MRSPRIPTIELAAMATRLAHLHDADEAAIWGAIPAVFTEVIGTPCDQSDAYHICTSRAIVEAVRGPRYSTLASPVASWQPAYMRQRAPTRSSCVDGRGTWVGAGGVPGGNFAAGFS